MIDLHTHTTESDGRSTPAELVALAQASDVTVLAVTDHDTVSGCRAVAAACETAGIEFVSGIEATAVHSGTDLHVLGYFFEEESPALLAFLTAQRLRRVERVREVVTRLAGHGIVLDADAILQPAVDDPRKAAGRPWVARALVAAGYVSTSDEAFERWLGRGRPGFVPRVGASAADVIGKIHEAGGIASLAHPVLVRHDEWIPGLADQGLDAIEAYHSEHDEAVTARYVSMAARLGLAVTGGSDYHGDPSHGPDRPGAVSLPRAAFDLLVRLSA